MDSSPECNLFGDTFHTVGLLDWLAVVLRSVCGPSRRKLICLSWSSHMYMLFLAVQAKLYFVESVSVDRIIYAILMNWGIYHQCDSYDVFVFLFFF